MSIKSFWRSVRTALSLWNPRVETDSARLDPISHEEAIRNAVIWLSPASVAGFNASDFRFLPDEDQRRLEDAVEEFRKVAEKVPAQGPAKKAQIERASRFLNEIVTLLQCDKYYHAEEFQAAKIAATTNRPAWVVDVETALDEDASGEPVGRFWVIATDEAANAPTFVGEAERFRKQLEQAVRAGGFPYRADVLFRRESEQREMGAVQGR
jgi:hypothetical protein